MTAKDDRDEAMKRVLDHEHERWKQAYRDNVGSVFYGFNALTGEDVRERLTPIIGHPRHHNSWSSMVNGLVRAKPPMILKIAMRHMHGPLSHARNSPTYEWNPQYPKKSPGAPTPEPVTPRPLPDQPLLDAAADAPLWNAMRRKV